MNIWEKIGEYCKYDPTNENEVVIANNVDSFYYPYYLTTTKDLYSIKNTLVGTKIASNVLSFDDSGSYLLSNGDYYINGQKIGSNVKAYFGDTYLTNSGELYDYYNPDRKIASEVKDILNRTVYLTENDEIYLWSLGYNENGDAIIINTRIEEKFIDSHEGTYSHVVDEIYNSEFTIDGDIAQILQNDMGRFVFLTSTNKLYSCTLSYNYSPEGVEEEYISNIDIIASNVKELYNYEPHDYFLTLNNELYILNTEHNDVNASKIAENVSKFGIDWYETNKSIYLRYFKYLL